MVVIEQFEGNADLRELFSELIKTRMGEQTLTRALWGSASFNAGSLKARTKVSTD